jgi:hypothetical protein
MHWGEHIGSRADADAFASALPGIAHIMEKVR